MPKPVLITMASSWCAEYHTLLYRPAAKISWWWQGKI